MISSCQMRKYRVQKLFFMIAAWALCLYPGEGKAQSALHVIDLKTPEDARRFLQFAPGRRPVIAGHRGTVEGGFPENAIEGMEHTLKFTPAIFEIDPRMTRDSVIVLMHDATLDRTTTGSGNIADHTFAELQNLRLKDAAGNPTPYKIPTLAAAIEWARGKTILNLDQKGVPYPMIADLIKKHRAEAFVMITTHSAEHARFYLNRNPDQIFSAHIKTREQFEEYEKAGIPFSQLMAYIGPHIKEENQELYSLLHAKGAMAMISSASSYDKLPTKGARREKYKAIIRDGASVLETDFPIEAAEALRKLHPKKAPKKRFIRKK